MTVFFLLERELATPKTLTFHYCFLNYRYFYVDVADGSAATVIPSFLVGLFFPWLRLCQDLVTCAQPEALSCTISHTITKN